MVVPIGWLVKLMAWQPLCTMTLCRQRLPSLQICWGPPASLEHGTR